MTIHLATYFLPSVSQGIRSLGYSMFLDILELIQPVSVSPGEISPFGFSFAILTCPPFHEHLLGLQPVPFFPILVWSLTLSVDQFVLLIIPLLRVTDTLPELLAVILHTIQPWRIFKLEREMVKQIDREKVNRKIKTEACYHHLLQEGLPLNLFENLLS